MPFGNPSSSSAGSRKNDQLKETATGAPLSGKSRRSAKKIQHGRLQSHHSSISQKDSRNPVPKLDPPLKRSATDLSIYDIPSSDDELNARSTVLRRRIFYKSPQSSSRNRVFSKTDDSSPTYNQSSRARGEQRRVSSSKGGNTYSSGLGHRQHLSSDELDVHRRVILGQSKEHSDSSGPGASSSFTLELDSLKGNISTPRKRVVDALLNDENPDRSSPIDRSAHSHSPSLVAPISAELNMFSVSRPDPEIFEEISRAQNSQDSAILPPALPGTSRRTYASQRSFLGDLTTPMDFAKQNDLADSSTNAFGNRASSQSQRPDVIASLLHYEENEGTESVQSIHELRHAGKNARFLSEVESLMDGIEQAGNTTSVLCSDFIQLCKKLLQPECARRFNECGLNARLIDGLKDSLGHLPVTLCLCACELSQSHSAFPTMMLTTHWSKLLDLTPALLEIDNSILQMSKNPSWRLSRIVKSDLQEFLLRLRSALFDQMMSVELSPRLIALKSLQHTSSDLRDVKASDCMKPMSSGLLKRLVSIVDMEAASERQDGASPERFAALNLALSILENCTVIPRSLPDGYGDEFRTLRRLHLLLHPNSVQDGLKKGTMFSYIRLVLNITNNSPELCNAFATDEMIGSLVNVILDNLGKFSEESAENMIDLVILALGALINLAEESQSSRMIFIQRAAKPESYLQQLLKLFFNSFDSISGAHSVAEIQSNVAIGYLSILLVTLCVDVDTRSQVRCFLDGKGLSVILATVHEFLQIHKKVEQDSNSTTAEENNVTGFMTRLQHLLAHVQDMEDRDR